MATIEPPHARLRRRSLSQSSLEDPASIRSSSSTFAIPAPFPTKRSVSCVSAMNVRAGYRIRIRYQDDALRVRAHANSQQLLQSALDESNQLSNSARIAKKALKYRNVLDRMTGVDVNDPAFDASKFLGVDWCKTILLEQHAPSSPPVDSDARAES